MSELLIEIEIEVYKTASLFFKELNEDEKRSKGERWIYIDFLIFEGFYH